MNLSNVRVNKNIPKDPKFIRLFQAVMNRQLSYYECILRIEGIKPFSNYVPIIDESFRRYVFKKLDSGESPGIYVYMANKYFTMSDDYKLFYLYRNEIGATEIPCFCLGECVGKYVVRKKMIQNPPIPEIEIIKNSALDQRHNLKKTKSDLMN